MYIHGYHLLIFDRQLEQHNGQLSQRAKEKEFTALTESEVKAIEKNFRSIMIHRGRSTE